MPESDLLTDRLRLRLMDARDAALYRALYTDARVMAAIGPPMCPEAADAAFERVLAHNLRGTPGHRHWAVALLDAEPAGLTALLRDGRTAEWGVLLMPPWQGRGLAGEVLDALMPAAFAEPRVDAIRVCSRGGTHGVRVARIVEGRGFTRDLSAPAGTCRWWLQRSARKAPPDWQQPDAPLG